MLEYRRSIATLLRKVGCFCFNLLCIGAVVLKQNPSYADCFIDYWSRQKAWRETELTVEHLDQEGTTVATLQMRVRGHVSLDGDLTQLKAPHHPWPLTIQPSDVTIDFTDSINPHHDFHFTSITNYQRDRGLFWRLIWFQSLLQAYHHARLGEDGFVHYWVDLHKRPNKCHEEEHIAIVNDVVRLLVQDSEFILAGERLELLGSLEHFFSIPSDPGRVCRGLATTQLAPRKVRCHIDIQPASHSATFDENENRRLIKAIGYIDLTWDPVAGLDCQLDECYEFWGIQGNWSSDRSWRIPGRARIQLKLRTYAPRN